MTNAATLDRAVAQAHIPSLLLATIHLTGDTSFLSAEFKPAYPLFADGDSGIPADKQRLVRAAAKAAMLAHIGGKPLAPPPSHDLIRRMMDFTAGTAVPERYVAFLRSELGLGAAAELPPRLRTAKKVIVIGAGMSGLLMAVKLKEAGVDLRIVEKSAEVGGTWFENSYPGCRVDTPNHLYSYSFEPNHAWPQRYSTRDVLLDYFRGVAGKHDLRRRTLFETRVVACTFDDAACRWTVVIEDKTGARSTLEADAVVSAVGQLNQPLLPVIAGRESFAGAAFHSAQWRHDVDLTGKRVAVIGTGASAYQLVPEIAPRAKELLVFQRSAPWPMPTGDYHDPVGDGEKWLLEHFPFYEKWYRARLFWRMTGDAFAAVKADPAWRGPAATISRANAVMRVLLVSQLRKQFDQASPLFDSVVPDYPFGGKRPLRDNGLWVRTLHRGNVRLVTDAIRQIVPRGIVTGDGQEHAADVIVYATGFRASSFLSTFEVAGRGGVTLEDRWRGDARAYLGITVPDFPNFFLLFGPNTNVVVNGSIVFQSECAAHYVLGCLALLERAGAKALVPRGEVYRAFNDKIDAANRMMAWGAPQVSSWYKNASGRVSQNWPFPLLDYWAATRQPDPADFELLGANGAA